MRKPKKTLRFFLDASTPDSVGRALQEEGFEVIYHRDALEDGTKDPIVCQTAMLNEAVLVSVDGDMKQLVKRSKRTDDKLKKLDLLICICNAPLAAKRIREAIALMRHEWEESQAKEARRFRIEITPHYIVTYR